MKRGKLRWYAPVTAAFTSLLTVRFWQPGRLAGVGTVPAGVAAVGDGVTVVMAAGFLGVTVAEGEGVVVAEGEGVVVAGVFEGVSAATEAFTEG
ncbi:hypothetical protein K4749_15970 [Streptomyces sp. TRM72054]|uniref:hypothetical protein n=1 Tax=Streptomyces sp. TRM72054 TaxID=2870562 RepID=UPI001C8B6E0A|nr:hypothetical protein [Streptomyces sp. TRM72054]MBX9395060.1 hypothetical protein [Streptomyces sp. TRM72054]